MEDTKTLKITEDVRQSLEYGKYISKIGWKVFNVQCSMFIRKIGPFGVAKIQRYQKPLVWKEINKILKKERVFLLKLEPLNNVQGSMFNVQRIRQDGWPLLGTKTLRISLSPSTSEILANFKKDCRYALRKCSRLNVQCSINKFDEFYEIWRRSSKRLDVWIPGEKEYRALVESFGKKCFCISIEDKAGALILTHKETAFYYFAGATKEGNELNLPYLVVWEAMKEAKKRGYRIWDFEGIYDPRWPNKRWKGFSHFKKSFGGAEIDYPGCFSKWRWPY